MPLTPAGGPRTTDTSSQRCPSLHLPLRRRPKAALLPDHRTLRVLPESSSPGIRKGIASLPSGLRLLQIPLLSIQLVFRRTAPASTAPGSSDPSPGASRLSTYCTISLFSVSEHLPALGHRLPRAGFCLVCNGSQVPGTRRGGSRKGQLFLGSLGNPLPKAGRQSLAEAGGRSCLRRDDSERGECLEGGWDAHSRWGGQRELVSVG